MAAKCLVVPRACSVAIWKLLLFTHSWTQSEKHMTLLPCVNHIIQCLSAPSELWSPCSEEQERFNKSVSLSTVMKTSMPVRGLCFCSCFTSCWQLFSFHLVCVRKYTPPKKKNVFRRTSRMTFRVGLPPQIEITMAPWAGSTDQARQMGSDTSVQRVWCKTADSLNLGSAVCSSLCNRENL